MNEEEARAWFEGAIRDVLTPASQATDREQQVALINIFLGYKFAAMGLGLMASWEVDQLAVWALRDSDLVAEATARIDEELPDVIKDAYREMREEEERRRGES